MVVKKFRLSALQVLYLEIGFLPPSEKVLIANLDRGPAIKPIFCLEHLLCLKLFNCKDSER